MAVVWQQHVNGTTYEVRKAGQSTRLYSNGVLHTQYHPHHVISGAIWDLLLLPAFLPDSPPRKILLLGLGGGALVNSIRYFFPSSEIDCVDIDPIHIQIAQRWFGIPTSNLNLHLGDAYEFLKSNNTKYDWIIDDVFHHVSGEPERCRPIAETLRLIRKRLNRTGMISLNLIGRNQVKSLREAQIDRNESLYQFTHPLYENCIVALTNSPARLADMKSRMNQFKELDQKRKTCRLKYRITKLV